MNVVDHALDLHFQCHKCWNVHILKMVSANEKRSGVTFMEVDIRHRMAPW